MDFLHIPSWKHSDSVPGKIIPGLAGPTWTAGYACWEMGKREDSSPLTLLQVQLCWWREEERYFHPLLLLTTPLPPLCFLSLCVLQLQEPPICGLKNNFLRKETRAEIWVLTSSNFCWNWVDPSDRERVFTWRRSEDQLLPSSDERISDYGCR